MVSRVLPRFRLLLGASVLLVGFASAALDRLYPDAVAELSLSAVNEGHFERVVALRQQESGESAAEARRTVLRDLASIAAQRERWAEAIGQSRGALQISRELEDADGIMSDGLHNAHYLFWMGQRGEAAVLARELAAMAETLDRPNELEDAWLILAKVHQVSGGRDKANELFQRILDLPSRHPFAVLQQQARYYSHENPEHQEALQTIWQRALMEAKTDAEKAVAYQHLGELAMTGGDMELALRNFEFVSESQARASLHRSPAQWHLLAQVQRATGQPEQAIASLRQGIDQADTNGDADERIMLRANLANALIEKGQTQAAYEQLRLAYDERVKIGRNQQTIRFSRVPVANPNDLLADASELAAVRNALRDAKLARTQAHNRQIAATAIAIALLAALLALAFLLKRRAAQAATLRAENAQLEALRYQLNPHFLFNSLANLNGLILTSPDRARQTVRRLSDFCRLALTRHETALLPIKDEAERLRAYLDVALAAEEDDLQIELHVDPAAENQSIPPLLIQPLLENALKYAAPNASDQRIVTATITAPTPTSLRITISNTGPWERPAPARPSSGVGLKNLHDRLTRYYPRRHELTFEKSATQVTAKLTIQQA